MKTISKNILKNQRGQAVLEYVLLLFLVLVVALAILLGVARSTQTFFNNYYGEYFACLLETGELPQLGSDGNPETECDELYEPFSVTDGRNPIGGPNGGTGNNSGSGDNNNNPDKNKDDSADNSDGNGSSAEAGSSAGGGGSSTSGFSAGIGSGRKTVPLSRADRGGGAGDDEDSDGTVRFNNFQQDEEFGESGTGRSQYVPVYGYTSDIEDEKKDQALAKAPNTADPEQALRGSRVPAKVETKKSDQEVADAKLEFPDYIRFLIIAAILLVIFIFFGGQIMQYQKSKD